MKKIKKLLLISIILCLAICQVDNKIYAYNINIVKEMIEYKEYGKDEAPEDFDVKIDAKKFADTEKLPCIRTSIDKVLYGSNDFLSIDFFDINDSENTSEGWKNIQSIVQTFFRMTLYISAACLLTLLIYIATVIVTSSISPKLNKTPLSKRIFNNKRKMPILGLHDPKKNLKEKIALEQWIATVLILAFLLPMINLMIGFSGFITNITDVYDSGKDAKEEITVYVKDSSNLSTTSSAGKNVGTFLATIEEYSKKVQEDYKNGKYWEYSNGNSTIGEKPQFGSFAKAAASSDPTINCARALQWALYDMGILSKHVDLYGIEGEIAGYSDAKEELERYADCIEVNDTAGNLLEKNFLKAGDMLFYKGHANVYAGNGQWYESGSIGIVNSSSNCEDITRGGHTIHLIKTIGPGGSYGVGKDAHHIIRLKDQSTNGTSAAGKADENSTYKSSISSSSSSITTTQNTTYNSYMFLGDSRTVGMKNAVNSDDIFICKESMGYDWMVKTAFPQADKKVTSGMAIAIWFGVNDMGNVDNYIKAINEKAIEWKEKGARTFYISVGPMDKSDEKVAEFNETMKNGLSNDVTYVDIYSKLKSDGFETVDGLHYTVDSYKKIYDLMKEGIKGRRK